MKNREFLIALAGNPNCGKSTLFNELTGSRQHVSNYPGVTVEKKEGITEYDGIRLRIVDLPGIYSLTAYSLEEIVARNFLVDEKPHCVVNIVDAVNLERHLYLTVQLLELGMPVVLALNMMDLAEKHGIQIDVDKLSQRLGIPVVPMVARTGRGKEDLLKTITHFCNTQSGRCLSGDLLSYGPDIDPTLDKMEKIIMEKGFLTGLYPPRWVALKYLEEDEQIIKKGDLYDKTVSEELKKIAGDLTDHLMKTLDTYPEAIIADHRYGYISALLKKDVVRYPVSTDVRELTDKIDRVVTNRFFGPLIMIGVLYATYTITFTYSEKPVIWLEAAFELFAAFLEKHLPPGPLQSLIVDGVVGGVGAVLGFIPIILLMFLCIAFLEDTGYLARVAYMLDRIFRTFGLHGNSVMAFIVGGGIAGGCAVPGVMATRTLRSSRERMATILTTPFMNCGAKLPVYAVIIAAFFPGHHAQVMLFLTLLAWLIALVMAWVLRSTILKGPPTPFLLELPTYRLPTFKGLMIHTWERTWQYIRKAGTIILAISILLWALMTFPGLPDEEKAAINERRATLLQKLPEDLRTELNRGNLERKNVPEEYKSTVDELIELKEEENRAIFYNSFASRIGRSLTSITKLCGFDWKTNIALLGGFAAKEVIVSTMGTAYSITDSENGGGLSTRLRNDPSWTMVKAWAFLLFVMLYSPCLATVACIAKETGSIKWAIFSVLFNTAVAFIVATLIYQGGCLFLAH
ncbi:ferrous iron transport protein B [Thermodesulforhabdus norvegica]|uniref:Ferrous iron transport protein B n=1 Tax=Thermodesulforhabdus norvegica TaxID=39841 RepID=A0A1I4URI9_9BACT|nr:ferrous iron transport protein B [Thermodesulforhabdus norvegica]SFM91528.1 ferrous iron transport protein B [Thermodesulforhabdus norvegica]